MSKSDASCRPRVGSFAHAAIIYQSHRSLAMKLIDLRARTIERVGRVGRVPSY